MNNNLSRYLAISGLALSAAFATAQPYPIEFDVSPVTTNVALNTVFSVDITAKTTDGLSHPLAALGINVQWDPSLYTPNGATQSLTWCVADNGFTFPNNFPPTAINSDGANFGIQGGSGFFPVDITINPTAMSILTLTFKSLGTNGSGPLGLPMTYGNDTGILQYIDGNGSTHTLNGADANGGPYWGLVGGTVNVGAAPEPVSVTMLALGALGLLRRARARR